MATKAGRMVTYLDGIASISLMALESRGLAKSHGKLKISPLPQSLWPPNLSG